MTQVFHYTARLNQEYGDRGNALLEYRLRSVRGIVSACVLKDNTLSVYAKDRQALVRALLAMKLLCAKDALEVKAKKEKADIKAVSEELKNYKLKALVSLFGFGCLEAFKRFSPTAFTNLSFLRTAFVLLIAKDFFKEGLLGLIKNKSPNADTLTATAVLASVLSGKPESSLSLLVLSNFAEMLTIGAAEKARQHISTLLDMKEKYVWHRNEKGHVSKVSIDDVKVNDEVVVFVGEKICVDGEIIEGEASIDQSSLTGESVPAFKGAGEDVYAGTVVRSGEITIRVSKVGDQTNLARIINMVENAQNRRAPIQNFADRMANALVPISFLSAAVVYGVTRDFQRVLNMFFIDFSCGLKLSTSTAISASISKAAQIGVLVKGGNFIETLADIDTVILDKTGTITDGHPILIDTIRNQNVDEKELVLLAAAAEKSSSHPLAEAVINYAQNQGWSVPQDVKTQTVVGRGISACVSGNNEFEGGEILVGSRTFMKEKNILGVNDIDCSAFSKECNIIYVARNGDLLGALVITDPIRKDIKKTINRIRRIGVDEIIMLTGDNKVAAEYVASKLDLDGYKSEVLPHEKAEFVASKQSYSKVLMVGDGINDAPALAYSDIGVALGGKSTDIAMESADITITSDEPLKLAKVMELSKATMGLVRQNFAATIAINSAAMMLGALGKINPLIAATIHNAATIGVVINSARILFDKKFNYEKIKRNQDMDNL
ncbi:MAG: heavy metal translocating P-type ATPase [Succinivibrio sp.]